uniref:hypothetical protein n=1 Tax=Parasutterella excrementihominis TaxID=487175 RepID=UPI003FEEB316
MATLTSQEILNATVSMGLSKANQCWIARAANTLLAGMYIAIGGFLAIRIGLALPWEQWGGMSEQCSRLGLCWLFFAVLICLPAAV